MLSLTGISTVINGLQYSVEGYEPQLMLETADVKGHLLLIPRLRE